MTNSKCSTFWSYCWMTETTWNSMWTKHKMLSVKGGVKVRQAGFGGCSVAVKRPQRWCTAGNVELCEKGRTAACRASVQSRVLWRIKVGINRSSLSQSGGSTEGKLGQLMKEKSKSAKISWCSAVRTQGVRGRVRTGLRRVNSSSKLLTSFAALMFGRKGGFNFLARRASQSIGC